MKSSSFSQEMKLLEPVTLNTGILSGIESLNRNIPEKERRQNKTPDFINSLRQ